VVFWRYRVQASQSWLHWKCSEVFQGKLADWFHHDELPAGAVASIVKPYSVSICSVYAETNHTGYGGSGARRRKTVPYIAVNVVSVRLDILT
jgi:hypothetical protein